MMAFVRDSIHDQSTELYLIEKLRYWEIGKLASQDLDELKLQVQQIDELYQMILYRSLQGLLMILITYLEAAQPKLVNCELSIVSCEWKRNQDLTPRRAKTLSNLKVFVELCAFMAKKECDI